MNRREAFRKTAAAVLGMTVAPLLPAKTPLPPELILADDGSTERLMRIVFAEMEKQFAMLAAQAEMHRKAGNGG